MSSTMRVLTACYVDWNSHLHLSSHNVAAAFASADWEVVHVSTAISPVQILRDRREFASRLGRFSLGGFSPRDGLWSMMLFAPMNPHNISATRPWATVTPMCLATLGRNVLLDA